MDEWVVNVGRCGCVGGWVGGPVGRSLGGCV